MKTYLPNYFKKIGISLVIISIFVSMLATMRTHIDESEYEYYSQSQNVDDIENLIANPFTAQVRTIIEWSGILLAFGGLFMYMFSREKIEDEFIQILRYKSLMKSLVYTWIFTGLLYLLKDVLNTDGYIIEFSLNTEALGVLELQLILYAIIFHRSKKKY